MVNRVSLEPLQQAFSKGATILVPNNRLRDALIDSYAVSQTKDVFATPSVISIDVWIREIWEEIAHQGLSPFAERFPLSSSEELFLWTSIIEKERSNTPLLNPEETARSVSHAYQLLRQWKLEELHLDTLLSYRMLPDIAVFLDWKKQFEALCQREKLASLADCLALINTYFRTCEHSPLNGCFSLFGFSTPPPLYDELFDHLSRYHEVERIEPGRCKPLKDRTHYTFDSWTAELEAVSQWACDRLREAPGAHIGLIGELNESQLNDVKLRVERTLNQHALLEFGAVTQIINSSQIGSTLIQEPVIHDALLMIGLIREQQSGEDLCRLLHSPFLIHEEDSGSARIELERVIRKRLTARCRVTDLLYLAGETDKNHHCPRLFQALGKLRELQRRHPKQTDSTSWMQLFVDILKTLGWPGTDLTRHQLNVLGQWRDILEQFARLSAVTGPFDLSTSVGRLRLLCRSTQTQQYFSQRANIAVYRPEEAVGLQFDHLWFINMNDQVWPPGSAPSPFLPYGLQFDQKIPGSHSSVQFTQATAVFDTLNHAARHSLKSSHHQYDDDQEFRASSFITDFVQVFPETDPTLSLKAFYGYLNYGNQQLTQTKDDSHIPVWPLPQAVGGHQVLSDQASCPFKAFARHRLNASPLSRFEIGISAAERGTALHHALDHLFDKLPTREALQALSHEECTSLCYDAADVAVGYLRRIKKALMTPTFLRIEKERTAELLSKFLSNSHGEAERLPYSIEEKEKKHHWSFEELQFTFKLDRMDRLDNKSLAIIDYKTGKSSPSSASLLADRPEDLQIPFYFTAMSSLKSSPIGAVSWAHINPAKTEYKGLSCEGNFHSRIKGIADPGKSQQSWSEFADHFPLQVTRFIGEFKSGRLVVDPVDSRTTCRYCGLHSLCRISEQTETGAADAASLTDGEPHE